MYDLHLNTQLLQQRAAERGMSPYRISQRTGVCYRTVRRVLMEGTGWPQSVYKIAKELGFDVKQIGRKPTATYDLSAVVMRRKSA